MSEMTDLPPSDPADAPSETRRGVLRMMSALGMGAVLPPAVLTALDASANAARAAVQPGAPVEPLQFWIPNWPDMIEIARQLTDAWKKLGISVQVKQGTLDTWTAEIIGQHQMPHLAAMSWGGAPDRIDPDYFLTEFYNSSRLQKGGINYGEFNDPKYDAVNNKQREEMDDKKRQELVFEAQAVAAAANPSLILFSRNYIQAYNNKRFEGVVPVTGSGIAMPYIPWTYLKMTAKTGRKLVKSTSIYDIHTLNPFATPEVYNSTLLRWIYPTFVIRDEQWNLTPWAAESFKVVDPTTVDVVIRDGMKFHDGKPVTIEDAKFTFDFIAQWKFPSFARVTSTVESTEIIPPRTLRFHLKQPNAPFLANVLGFTFIAPKHIWEKVASSGNLKTPADYPNDDAVGSGPFKLGEWKRGEYLFLKSNPDWWMAPKIDGVYWLVVPNLENQMGMMERGEADLLGWYIDRKQGDMLAKNPDLTVVSTPTHGLHEIRMHVTMAPLDEPNLRLALQQATDRQMLLDLVFGGAGVVAYNTPIIPINKFWSNPNVPNPTFSIEAARKTLEKAGYSWNSSGELLYPKG
ncbi:ABC transporter substrate-binding protein [Bradyrhizobium sp. NP1]|uniref:ABC transporter substrate-binding protein n=1 Tax=Bradyrhizobium sp. NP1 TaxID=3049772 RepID=UPI0025A6565B|nr:ABC transporter substrate-binding protein [Bradyrhizobium sp. NP1]WJR80021.1 ABC transporter substrate-binding protein [Bradyrhizobium sp. NP1]